MQTTTMQTTTRAEGFSEVQIRDLAATLNVLLADVFTLYIKTKNFHWHLCGAHFREYHLLLDEHAGQIFAMTDVLAERVRKIGATTLHSIGQIAQLQRIQDNDVNGLTARSMLGELATDERALLEYLRDAHARCDQAGDVATASLIENWVDETERRVWFLTQTLRG